MSKQAQVISIYFNENPSARSVGYRAGDLLTESAFFNVHLFLVDLGDDETALSASQKIAEEARLQATIPARINVGYERALDVGDLVVIEFSPGNHDQLALVREHSGWRWLSTDEWLDAQAHLLQEPPAGSTSVFGRPDRWTPTP